MTGQNRSMADAHHARTIRREDPPLLRGEGRFIDGLDVPELAGAAHAVFVRSTQPHGLITSIDISDAAEMPGVLAIWTGDDLTDVWVLPPRLPIMNKAMVRPMLAQQRVRFVGEPVAIVIASSRAEATDAAELVIVDYEPLPALVDIVESHTDEIILHEAAGTNVSFAWQTPTFENDPFADCDVVVEFDMRHPRLNAAPMEPRCGAVFWTSEGRCITYVNSQRPNGARYVIECALGLEPNTVRAIAPDVGGGFGAKGGYGCHPEDVVLAWASRRLATPLRWTETRNEAMLGMAAGRASNHHVRIGATNEGRISAYEVVALQDSGAYPAMGTFITTNLRNSGTGVYDIPIARVQGTSVVTNTTPTSALRGAGRPEAACDIERAMDQVAGRLGLDPVEIRRRNLVPPDVFPYTTAVGSTYDSGRYGEALDRCIAAADYAGLRAEQVARRAAGGSRQMGIGVSCTVESTGGAEGETSTVSTDEDGVVTLIFGTAPHGQSHATTFAALVGEELGVDETQVRVICNDTDFVRGGGTIGSRSAQLGGAASALAARDLIEVAKSRAAELLEASVDDVVFDKGIGFHVAGTPSVALGWVELGPLSAVHDYKQSQSTFAFGACVAVVEVDTETGKVAVRSITAVDDAGVILQPQLAEGQVHGGLGLAVAAALYEEMAYDADGTPKTANFADYAIVSAAEMPSFVLSEMETPSPINPLGVKGVGESGTVMATPALQSAVLDALSPFGIAHLDLPLTPERVWRAMHG